MKQKINIQFDLIVIIFLVRVRILGKPTLGRFVKSQQILPLCCAVLLTHQNPSWFNPNFHTTP
jgi:hypothetical protein